MESHLLQMRGLKQKVRSENLTCVQSHLLQMRGLKLCLLLQKKSDDCRIFYRCVD